MQKIIRYYVIITSFLLCLTFLAAGVIGVNEETSYVISGKKEDILRVQSTTSERLLVKEGEETTNLLSFADEDKESFLVFIAGILPSPFSQMVWGIAT